MAIVPFQAFADSSRGGIVERHVQCAQNPMYLVESEAPSGSHASHPKRAEFQGSTFFEFSCIYTYCLPSHDNQKAEQNTKKYRITNTIKVTSVKTRKTQSKET